MFGVVDFMAGLTMGAVLMIVIGLWIVYTLLQEFWNGF